MGINKGINHKGALEGTKSFTKLNLCLIIARIKKEKLKEKDKDRVTIKWAVTEKPKGNKAK